MYTSTTPTFTLSLPEEIDLSNADHVYVTFASNGKIILNKMDEELFIKKNEVSVTLSQAETRDFPHRVTMQVNWTYTEAGKQKRACTNVKTLEFKTNLVIEELQ